ncbi:putative disease resistance protein [Citrus sinensis]|uniref:Disease resistance protein n=1 Tax=Citrus sinensis TaxID=2711 RepID=A0ACB8JBW0_CITSI|nr:putative disease resistance protein [Citrus sinensis]
MAYKKKPEEWRYAIEVLRKSSSSEFAGLVKEVYPLLKFSYDSLQNDVIRSCFLYCCLYPEDFAILKRDLIDCWIGEGFLDERDSFSAQNQGYYIVGTLVHAWLLEEVGDDKVKLHGVLHDMALWISCEIEEEKENFLVCAETNIKELLGELKALVNLKCVNLEWARDLVTIPLEVISNFSKLRVLRLFGTEELDFTLRCVHSLQILVSSNKLQSCTRALVLIRFKDSKSIDVIALARLKHLSTLHFSKCEELEEWKTDYTSGTEEVQFPNSGIRANGLYLGYTVWTILAPQENYQEGGVGLANYSRINKGDTDILADDEFPFDRRLAAAILCFIFCLAYRTASKMSFLNKVDPCAKLRKLPLDSNSALEHKIAIRGEAGCLVACLFM